MNIVDMVNSQIIAAVQKDGQYHDAKKKANAISFFF